MAVIKGEITITKGFDHWKSMVFSQKEKMAGMGMQFLFAGTEKNDPTNFTLLSNLRASRLCKHLVLTKNLQKPAGRLAR